MSFIFTTTVYFEPGNNIWGCWNNKNYVNTRKYLKSQTKSELWSMTTNCVRLVVHCKPIERKVLDTSNSTKFCHSGVISSVNSSSGSHVISGLHIVKSKSSVRTYKYILKYLNRKIQESIIKYLYLIELTEIENKSKIAKKFIMTIILEHLE